MARVYGPRKLTVLSARAASCLGRAAYTAPATVYVAFFFGASSSSSFQYGAVAITTPSAMVQST